MMVQGEHRVAPYTPETQHLRRSNDPPNAPEETSIRSRLVVAQSEVQKLDAVIVRLNTFYRSAVKRRAATQTLADEYSGILSPLRRFPNEILSEVAL